MKKRDNFADISTLKLKTYIISMIDDICHQVNTDNSVFRSIQQFTLSLTYQNTPQKTVQINILNNQTFQSYQADVNLTFLADNQNLKKYFQDPQELYHFLSNNIDEIKISHDAKLTFELKLHGFCKAKLITINTRKIIVQKQTFIDKQIDNIKKQVKQRNKIINTLIQSNKKLEQKNLSQQKKLVDAIAKLNILYSYQQLGFHPHNSNNSNYTEKRLQKSIIITKVTKDDNYYRFINSSQIFQKSIRSYRIRIVSIPKSSLSLGFCDRDFFISKGSHQQNPHFLNYGCNGMINENGISFQAAVTSAAGEVIICTVDLREKRNKVTWKRDHFLIAERILPQCMKNRSFAYTLLQSIIYVYRWYWSTLFLHQSIITSQKIRKYSAISTVNAFFYQQIHLFQDSIQLNESEKTLIELWILLVKS